LLRNRGIPETRDGDNYTVFVYHYKQPNGVFPLFPGMTYQVFDGNYAYIHLSLMPGNEEASKGHHVLVDIFADSSPMQTIRKTVYELLFGSNP
jgi:hypothetical protein